MPVGDLEGGLVVAAQCGDCAALRRLVERYQHMVHRVVAGYRLPGGERADLAQEGQVGLLKAVRDFDPGAGVPFAAFAAVCVRRNMLTAVTGARRGKAPAAHRRPPPRAARPRP